MCASVCVHVCVCVCCGKFGGKLDVLFPRYCLVFILLHKYVNPTQLWDT